MNLAENFEKLRCARLQEQKQALLKRLNFLKQENLNNLLNEEPMPGQMQGQTSVNYAPYGQQSQQAQTGQQAQQNIKRSGQQRKIKKGTQAQSEDSPEVPEPEQMARPHHGFALTPASTQAQHELLTQYYDKPETPEQEVASEPTWQNLQQAIANYRGAQVNQLLRQQRMLG